MQLIDGWLDTAQVRQSPFYNERPARDISLIVIHNISLPAGQFGCPYIDDLFMGCLDCAAHDSFADLLGVEVSSHFLIRRTGEICQYVSTEQRAWHAGVSQFQGRENCNDFSVGIELEGTDEIPYEAVQYQQLAELCHALINAYDIPLENVTGHSDIAPGRKTDPGQSFDWVNFRQQLHELHCGG